MSDGRVPDVRIEPMRADDLDAVLADRARVLRDAVVPAGVPPRARAEPGRRAVGCARGAQRSRGGASPVVGYLCLWAVVDEVHVTNLAVDPARRGEGVGRLPARHPPGVPSCRAGRGARSSRCGPGNVWARRLYHGLGFQEVGRRRGYYIDTGEDALLLEARLDEGPFAGATGRTPAGTRQPGDAF